MFEGLAEPEGQERPVERTVERFLVAGSPEATRRLMRKLMERAGYSASGTARRLGVTKQSLNDQLMGHRIRISLESFTRFVTVCGGRIVVEWTGVE